MNPMGTKGAAGDQVLQNTEPGVTGFPRPEIQMQEHGTSIFQQRIGRQHDFLLIRALTRRMVLRPHNGNGFRLLVWHRGLTVLGVADPDSAGGPRGPWPDLIIA